MAGRVPSTMFCTPNMQHDTGSRETSFCGMLAPNWGSRIGLTIALYAVALTDGEPENSV